VALKDLVECLESPRALIVWLVVPSAVLGLVGQLRTQPPRVNVLVVAAQACGAGETDDACTLQRYLHEVSYVDLRVQRALEAGPLRTMARDGIHLLVDTTTSDEDWAVYVAETNPKRLPWLLELASGVRRITGDSGEDGLEDVLSKAGTVGAARFRPAFLFHPQSADRSLALLPMTFGLLVCFLPFAISAPSLIRERESHTLEVLLSAPGASGNAILAGKCAATVCISVASALLMLLVLQFAYHLYVKAGVTWFSLLLLLPMLSSAFLGLGVSALSRSQSQTMMAAAVYFFCLLLLSGFLYSIDESAPVVQFVSALFGLTYLLDVVNTWMFGGSVVETLPRPLTALTVQCVAYGAFAWATWKHHLRWV
jgi:ABC-type Na+ efflux pump permease subunit